MKKFLCMSVMALFSLVLFSCSGNSPEGVAKGFLTNIQDGDFEKAKEYCDKPTQQLLDMMISFGGEKIKEEIQKKKEEGQPDIEILRVEEKGEDKAQVFYKQGTEEDSLLLKKIDGKWKVSVDKENGKENNAPMEDMEVQEEEVVE